MLDFGFYNRDCVEGMKEFPDKYFDLAIVDPPYGDGGGEWSGRERFGERFDRYRNQSGGWHGKDKYNLEALARRQQQRSGRNMETSEVASYLRTGGRREKNHSVGHSPEAGIF